MDCEFRLKCNWSIEHGDLDCVAAVKILEEGAESERDIVSNIISDEFSTLLEKPNDEDIPCEITINIKPTYIPTLITIVVTDCKKLEMFSGSLNEYLKTIESEFVDEIEEAKIYRFDILIDQPITSFQFKLLTPSTELWIYGLQIVLKKNANYLANFLSSSGLGNIPGLSATSSINFQNVESILNSSKAGLSENAEKCKQFVETYSKMSRALPLNINNEILNFAKLNLNDVGETNLDSSANDGDQLKSTLRPLETGSEQTLLKMYIEEKFKRLEENITNKLNEIEERQNDKLDRILLLLGNENKFNSETEETLTLNK